VDYKKQWITDPGSRTLRVCFVSSYPPGRARLSEYGYQLVKELDDIDEIDGVWVLANENSPKIERYGEKTTVLRTWRPDNPLSIFLLIFKLLKLKPEVVHFNVHFFSMGNQRIANLVGLCLIPICRILGFRVVTTFHHFGSSDLELEEFGVKRSFFNRLGLALGNLLVTKSNIVASHTRNVQNKPKNVMYVPHGSTNPKDSYAACDCNSAILFFGVLSPYKGLECLIEAFQRMNDPDLRLIITDSPHPRFLGYSRKLKRIANGNGNIVFVDYVPEDDLPSFFSQGDVVVFPYTSCVGTSGAFHTAAGFGKATVMADLPVFRELMEQGAGGLVFPPRDVDALVDCLRRLLSNPSLIREIEDKNLQFARSRTWSKVARQYFQVYMKCLGKAS